MTQIKNQFIQKPCEDFMINDLIRKNQKVDLIVSSPPYNIKRPYDKYKDKMTSEEYLDWMIKLFNQFNKILSEDRVVLWNISYGKIDSSLPERVVADVERFTEFKKVDTIAWLKDNCTPISTTNRLDRIFEYVFVFARKSEQDSFHINRRITSVQPNGLIHRSTMRNMISCPNGKSKKGNEATFSVDLVKKGIEMYGVEGDLVFDPFMGTGTTGVGSLLSNCSFVGTEISEEQVEYSNVRLIPTERYVKTRFILNHVNNLKSKNRKVKKSTLDVTSVKEIGRIKELLSNGHSISSIRKDIHSEFNQDYSYQKIYSIKTLRCHKNIRKDLNEQIVSFLPDLSPEQKTTAKKVKELISEGFDRDYVCELYKISIYKYYQIHGLQGRYLTVGRHFNIGIKNKRRIPKSKVLEIKEFYSEKSGSFSIRRISTRFNLSESDVKNILGLKKHRNIGKELNENVFVLMNKNKSELKEKSEQEKLRKNLSEKSSNKIRVMDTQVAA
ncbi:MAG: site-specific DNA-methyltransferase [Bacteroidota bacterium]